jgi:hypothetical protein
MLAARAAQLAISDGGLTSEAISAAYLSYAALMALVRTQSFLLTCDVQQSNDV